MISSKTSSSGPSESTLFQIENRVHYNRSDPVLSDETIRISSFPSAESFDLKNLLKIAKMATLPKSE